MALSPINSFYQSTPLALVNARIIDPLTSYDGPGALKIENGKITDISFSDSLVSPDPNAHTVIDCHGMCVAPGIVDMQVFIGEPGARHKESFNSGGKAAAAGGVTTIVTQPDTNPVIDDPAMVEFIRHRAMDVCSVRVLPLAALTKGLAGDLITEYQFLRDAGAVGFSNAYHSIDKSLVFLRCLEYAYSTDSLVVGHPQDISISYGTCATEGALSTIMGLSAAPAISETIALERDILLAELTGARYHADQLSTRSSLESLRRARDRGVNITASTAVAYFSFNETEITGYRTFSKVSPPLRKENDRKAVTEALKEGLIDTIVSAHYPQDEESKRQPYEKSASGIVGLETILSASLKLYHDGHMSLPSLFRCLSLNPSKILAQDTGELRVGAPADIIVFDPDKPWVVDRYELLSKSKNTPFHKKTLQGYVALTIINGHVVFDKRNSIGLICYDEL
jgi:dihydroorotase